MGQTGLVALKKSSVTGLRINYPLIEHDDGKLERQDLNSFNSGGIAEARRPVWPAANNQTKRRKPNSKNRKPSGIVRDEDDEEHHQQHYYHKKKQFGGSGLPWFFNLMGPPGITQN
jgi:Zn-finger nucleic acid-binding protein